jgi:hypothetical protein
MGGGGTRETHPVVGGKLSLSPLERRWVRDRAQPFNHEFSQSAFTMNPLKLTDVRGGEQSPGCWILQDLVTWTCSWFLSVSLATTRLEGTVQGLRGLCELS